MTATRLRFTLDGRDVTCEASPATTLADLLGVHVGCGEGVCGSCTTVVDGVALRACLMLALQADGCQVETIASLAAIEGTPADQPTPLQRAFSAHRAFQCGWCLPGMLVGTATYLRDAGSPTNAELETHFLGHLCRCLGGARAIEATRAAIAEHAA